MKIPSLFPIFLVLSIVQVAKAELPQCVRGVKTDCLSVRHYYHRDNATAPQVFYFEEEAFSGKAIPASADLRELDGTRFVLRSTFSGQSTGKAYSQTYQADEKLDIPANDRFVGCKKVLKRFKQNPTKYVTSPGSAERKKLKDCLALAETKETGDYSRLNLHPVFREWKGSGKKVLLVNRFFVTANPSMGGSQECYVRESDADDKNLCSFTGFHPLSW